MGGKKMYIVSKIENTRELAETLQNWDVIIKEKRLDAIYGRHFGFDQIKVQNARNKDRMTKALIEVQEAEERRERISNLYWNERNEVLRIIEKHANDNDATLLYRYAIGCELSQIPLKKGQKHPGNVVKGAMKRLQAAIDHEEKTLKQRQAVMNLIRGKKARCKHCSTGLICYKGEEANNYIFMCEGCGKKYKAKKGA
jgi:hypothetical protein